uniref:KAT8 regulatory NSL complex subunit 3 n=1 Tax=Daphnia galeata TaxID=27404 RepID=A0A8J2S1U4_9CRUS|nr:unnamed protein product [Daphnia galeata]
MVVKAMEESREASISCRNISNGSATEPVQLDHCYAKPWNWRQEMAHCKPIRVLFAEDNSPVCDDVIDVDDSPSVKHHPILNTEVTDKNYMESVQKLNLLSSDENCSDWEETVKRDGWTPLQNRIFNKVVKLLIADNMAKLATEKLENEAIQKKIHVEGSAKKLRIILSSVSWDVKITQWLHLTLIEHLNRDYLLCYINMLQVLQSRVPTLVDRILNTPLTNSKLLTLNNQILNFVVGKPWEPALKPSVPPVTKVQPVTPFIIMVPSGTNNYNSLSSLSGSRRFQTWHNLLQTLGRVTTVSIQTTPAPQTLPLPMLVEAIINATVQKVQELKAGCPSRPIVLAGLQQGALIAAQVAYMEPVTALLCLGFPLFCVDGKRGEPDDFILDIKCPTMLIVGQSSSTCTVDGIEQLRHRMKAESSLIVVDGAVDSLRMLKWKRKLQNVTQSMVDACILEEISTFFSTVLTQVSNPVSGKKSPVERKADATSLNPGPNKRPRHQVDADDSTHSALSGHNYSQSTPFAPPWKGRSGTGLRVRGGRTGPGHTSRLPYQRAISEISPTTPKGRLARSLSTHRALPTSADHLPPRGSSQRANTSSALDSVEIDCKSSVGSSQGSPKEEGLHPPMECKGGGDSSETESAPPADDDDEIMEDLRFCNEFMTKQQHSQTPQKQDESMLDDDFCLKYSGDEADDLPLVDVCRRLSAENRNRTQNKKYPPADPPE